MAGAGQNEHKPGQNAGEKETAFQKALGKCSLQVICTDFEPGMSRKGLRIFAAIPIPQLVEGQLRGLPFPGCLRPVPAQGMHITLNFMGERDEAICREIAERLGQIRLAPFDLRLDGLGFFAKGPGAVLWAGVQHSQPLGTLKQMVDERVLRVAGMAPEKRPWRPHISLGRAKNANMGEIRSFTREHGQAVQACFPVCSFVLFKSDLTPSGPIYTRLGEFLLDG